jgi:hypothetical protein
MGANPDSTINVAAVCGTEVRIYDDEPKGGGPRLLLRTLNFAHHGAARLYAQEHDEAERAARARRQNNGR